LDGVPPEVKVAQSARVRVFQSLIISPSLLRPVEDVAAFEFGGEFFLAGEDEAVFGGEELLAFATRCVAFFGGVWSGSAE
jgi:hypothetical protein